MHTEFGIGTRRIVFLNTDKSPEVDILFEKLLCNLQMKHNLGYPEVRSAYIRNCYVFTSEINALHHASDCICFDARDLGVYTNLLAYNKQIAERISHDTGIRIYDGHDDGIHIGIGRDQNITETYLLLIDCLCGI